MRPFAFVRRRMARRSRTLVCQQAVELMTDYLEDALTPFDRARFESHLASCDACTAYLAQMRATVAALGHLRPDSLPREVRNELIDLYRRYGAG